MNFHLSVLEDKLASQNEVNPQTNHNKGSGCSGGRIMGLTEDALTAAIEATLAPSHVLPEGDKELEVNLDPFFSGSFYLK